MKQEINLSESDEDDNGGFNDNSFDDDLGSDREVGLNLGEALKDNDFKNKNIFSDKYKDKTEASDGRPHQINPVSSGHNLKNKKHENHS